MAPPRVRTTLVHVRKPSCRGKSRAELFMNLREERHRGGAARAASNARNQPSDRERPGEGGEPNLQPGGRATTTGGCSAESSASEDDSSSTDVATYILTSSLTLNETFELYLGSSTSDPFQALAERDDVTDSRHYVSGAAPLSLMELVLSARLYHGMHSPQHGSVGIPSSKGNVCNPGSLRRERDTAFRRRSECCVLPASFYIVVAPVVTHRQRRVTTKVTEMLTQFEFPSQGTRKQLKEMRTCLQQRIQQRETDLQQLRETVESHKCSAKTEVEDSERIFTELIRFIEKSCSEVTQIISDQEKAAVSQAEEQLEQLKQEINDLRRRDAELEQLSHTQNHIQFLQVTDLEDQDHSGLERDYAVTGDSERNIS
ncbi:hypothetical protein M9458_051989 [Cirrhinus mrigala]|uniref:TRIM8/14/16/25/29/45/65 coiled-coil region domain-containing protein n=1 Tax=Cirrhinus mrigala TaxID=683832 RepID=A0ABD0MUM6_CIRMR